MTLTLNLSPELENRLREAALAQGDDVESFVLRAVEDRLVHCQAPPTALSPDEWKARFEAWLATRTPVDHFVDDSRESIYS
jgi:hypothetical protein